MNYTCKQGEKSGGIFEAKWFTGYRNLLPVNQLEYLLNYFNIPCSLIIIKQTKK
jgi:hypothetical protein